jgi:hypothetical protein
VGGAVIVAYFARPNVVRQLLGAKRFRNSAKLRLSPSAGICVIVDVYMVDTNLKWKVQKGEASQQSSSFKRFKHYLPSDEM